MKNVYRFFSFILIVAVALQLWGTVNATGYQNYSTSPVSEIEQAAFFERLKNFELIDEKEEMLPIECFAISEGGLIALGFNGANAVINVYNIDGQFLYGYRFPNNNCAFAVFFEGEYLSIYWGKSQYIGSFDSEGNCIQFREVIHTQKSADAYHNDRYRPTRGKVGDVQYHAKYGLGLSQIYTRFTIEDPAGNLRVIYDVTEDYNMQLAVSSLLLFVFLLFFILTKRYNGKIQMR